MTMGMIVAAIVSGIFILIPVAAVVNNGTEAVLITAGILGVMYMLSRTEFAEGVVSATVKMSFGNYDVQNYVQNVIKKYIPIEKVPDNLRIGFINTQIPNAFAAGRRTVAVTAGLLKMVTEQELAGVIGHELGHLAAGDSMRLLATLFMYQPGIIAVKFTNYAMILMANIASAMHPFARIFVVPMYYTFVYLCRGLDWLTTLILMRESREAEFKADAYSSRLSSHCHRGLISFFTKLQSMETKGNYGIIASLMSSHPPTSDRILKLGGGTANIVGVASFSQPSAQVFHLHRLPNSNISAGSETIYGSLEYISSNINGIKPRLKVLSIQALIQVTIGVLIGAFFGYFSQYFIPLDRHYYKNPFYGAIIGGIVALLPVFLPKKFLKKAIYAIPINLLIVFLFYFFTINFLNFGLTLSYITWAFILIPSVFSYVYVERLKNLIQKERSNH